MIYPDIYMMAHDVFISYSKGDKTSADALCRHLEDDGIRCWIAPRDVEHGSDWTDSISEAIKGAKVLLVLFSHESANSRHVKSEVRSAFDYGKALFPVRISNITPAGGFDHLLGSSQWIDAFQKPLHQYFDHIHQILRKIIDGDPVPIQDHKIVSIPGEISALRRLLAWGIGIIIIVALTVVGIYMTNKSTHDPASINITNEDNAIPDTRTAVKSFQAKSLDDLQGDRCKIIDANQPFTTGYFAVTIEPNPATYAWARILLKDDVEPNYYASVRLGDPKNMSSLELLGRDVYFLVNPDFTHYLIWQSEENQTPWTPINVEVHPKMNTLGLYQKGRLVKVYINNIYLASFNLTVDPSKGQVGLYMKADGKKGGSFQFHKLSVWSY